MTHSCPRCGICHKDAERANKTGGHGYILPFPEGELCPVCKDRRRELAQKAVIRAYWYRQNKSDPKQATLDV